MGLLDQKSEWIMCKLEHQGASAPVAGCCKDDSAPVFQQLLLPRLAEPLFMDYKDHSGKVAITGSVSGNATMRDLERSRCTGAAPSSQIYSACLIAIFMSVPAFLLCDPPGVLGPAKLLGYLSDVTFCMQSVALATLHQFRRHPGGSPPACCHSSALQRFPHTATPEAHGEQDTTHLNASPVPGRHDSVQASLYQDVRRQRGR